MITLLIFFVAFFCVIRYIVQQFYREQKVFQQKMERLQIRFAECNRKAVRQRSRVQLLDELEKTLKTNKALLSDAIFQLHYDVFELLSQNNLLKQK